jgi:hypothetical protein
MRKTSKTVVTRANLCHGVCVKAFTSKPQKATPAEDAEVRHIHAAGKRIAADKKSILRVLAATGMYTATGKLKPQFR